MIRVRSLADPVECGYGRPNHCGLSRHVEHRRGRRVISWIGRMKDEREADAGIVACGGVCSPIVPVACRSTLAGLFGELDIVDRHIFRRSGVVHRRADARVRAFHNIHLNVFFKQVGP